MLEKWLIPGKNWLYNVCSFLSKEGLTFLIMSHNGNYKKKKTQQTSKVFCFGPFRNRDTELLPLAPSVFFFVAISAR